MIAVIAFFGTLILIGTLADTILNIMHLDIVPDSLLKVNNELSIMYHNYLLYSRSFKGFLLTVTH